MLKIGLTGGIASGKSVVASRLAGLGAVLVDADALARDVVEPGMPGLARVGEAVGPDSLGRGGRVFRLGVYASGTPEFKEVPKVADAGSELLRDVLGLEAVSARLVFGVASLPLGSPVELEVILELKA